ncbi:MAG TPA: tRNA guanosine(34) transglycosylase Tgt [Phycisphaeraceae bacterium]
MPALTFQILARDRTSRARLGRVTTPHGTFETPAFMPVGTRAAIKGLLPQQVADLGAQVILANTYHLMLRPGSERVAQMGGLHRWMRWDGPILTDSGGYQVFSLADISRIGPDGVTFKSHLDGSMIELTPERSITVQNQLGADIIMAFDDCPPAQVGQRTESRRQESEENGEPLARQQEGRQGAGPPATSPSLALRVKQACERTIRWLDRCVKAHARQQDQALFGIVQGGADLDQRAWCAQHVTQHDLPGYAIGGVAVGEGPELIRQAVEFTAPLLPQDRPRYLMGVGYERDILMAVRAGVDMFDCVLPTRNGRNANAFTPTGQVRLRNARYQDDPNPIDPDCDCPACAGRFSRSYLRHLFLAGEMLGPILVSMHNIRHFQRYLLDIRRAILHNDWSCIARRWPVAQADAL